MTWWSRSILSRSGADRWLYRVTGLSALVSAIVVALILVFLIRESWAALRTLGVGRFLSDSSWHPLSGQFNLLPMVAATGLATLGAVLVAGPLGIASAIFSRFYAPPRVAWWYVRLVELLAGIPSVVFGLWGLVVLVPLVGRLGGSGQSLLAAILVLGLMILPMVALTADAALRAVPAAWLEGGAALGLGRWAVAWRIALPAARRGIAVGLLLALCRALGETMAVVMVAGNVVQVPRSLLDPVRTLNANIALEMGYATAAHRSILFVSGLILMVGVCGMVILAGWWGSDDESS